MWYLFGYKQRYRHPLCISGAATREGVEELRSFYRRAYRDLTVVEAETPEQARSLVTHLVIGQDGTAPACGRATSQESSDEVLSN